MDWDDEDYQLEGLRPITIFDDDLPAEKGAELKFDIRGTDFGGEPNPDIIVDEDIGDGALTIQCDMTKVVHGKLSPKGPPATLIVFQFVFLPHGNNNRFKEANIRLTFSAGKVLKISPDNKWTTLPSERQQERSHTISPSIEATLGAAKATTSYTWQQKETETIRGYAKVTGEIKALAQSRAFGIANRRKNTVLWTLSEDEHALTGLPSLLETAVLVEREATKEQPLGEPFTASIKIDGCVNRWARTKDKWQNIGKWMSGSTREGEDVVFHPRAKCRGTAQNPEQLEDEDLEAYRHLIAFREWENPGEKTGAPAGDVPANAPLQVVSPTSAPLPKAAPTSNTAQNKTQVPSMAEKNNIAVSLANLMLPDTPIPPTGGQGVVPPLNHVTETAEIVDVDSEELPNLREQLRLVRAEANWVVRVIGLLAEERMLLERIRQLEGRGT